MFFEGEKGDKGLIGAKGPEGTIGSQVISKLFQTSKFPERFYMALLVNQKKYWDNLDSLIKLDIFNMIKLT